MEADVSVEEERLRAAYDDGVQWRRWGPYLSERQWGTVREDHGPNGEAWEYFPHDQARSRAYRWGEDGLLGICDDRQLLCFALSLWNGQDPILKERLFGLTNSEGNHGEDCKEYYYYLDSTPTHSYMKGLYRYPQRSYPYDDLVATNAARSKTDPEYELIDTGVFDEDRYFDVTVEYAKASPDDVNIRISVSNRGSAPADIRVLPTLWFRNTWSWHDDAARPHLRALPGDTAIVCAEHDELGVWELHCEGGPPLLFTENDTNQQRLFHAENPSPYVKDGIGRAVVMAETGAVNPERVGTKAAADYAFTVAAGETRIIRLRLVKAPVEGESFGQSFEDVLAARTTEADAFYDRLTPERLNEDQARVMRQALAGMLWSKQHYSLDMAAWMAGREPSTARNQDWEHLKAQDIISMPDKWEYPWFAVWDLAFHALALMLVDVDFAKHQLSMFLEDRYLRDDGAIPAYEWNFSDVNPPVHAFATLKVYQFEQAKRGHGDVGFLKWMFERLTRNFEWWIERKGVDGSDVFHGGFLGLDNIGVFDRSHDLPTGGHLEQSDGTAWMAFYAQVMLRLSLELCRVDPEYEDRALYFFDRVLGIAKALSTELWDDEDGFFYDVLRFPDGTSTKLKIRSLVGLLPLGAVSVFEPETIAGLPRLRERLRQVYESDETVGIHCPLVAGYSNRRMLAILDEGKLRRVITRMLDAHEFYSPHGVRSISRSHLADPYVFEWEGQRYVVRYRPAESDSSMFGGNSNWRGPVWIPINFLFIRSLLELYSFYGDTLRFECPTGSGRELTLYEIAFDLGKRLVQIFTRDASGRRPVFGGATRFQNDPNWRDDLLFYEYFNGDDGAGIGASHQTGWTGLVASILSSLGRLEADDFKNLDRATRAKMLAGTDGLRG